VIGVSVTFQYDEDFDHDRVVSIAEKARKTFEGMPGLRSKAFTVDDAHQRAMNFYVWESEDAARTFFSDELRERVTGPVRRRAHDRVRRDHSARRQCRLNRPRRRDVSS
jgi:heme-degrading monooxygenase HmoA